ncbi:MAG: phosphoribosylamine--glycine ligase, partial [Pyrinomonadaceae bacterium]
IGPNTGGMGAVTAPGLLSEAIREEAIRLVIEPTLEGLQRDGTQYRGVLYAGLMLTNDGIRVLEYNVRLGDPETQAQLVRLNTDLVGIYDAIITGGLANIRVEWKDVASACVILASPGYPSGPIVGAQINGLKSEATRLPAVHIFHSGTALNEEGEFVTAGGRVLGVTSTGQTLEQALSRCYHVIEAISWEGIHYRHDIGRFVK